MMKDMGKGLFESDIKNSTVVQQPVLLFCSKHPRMKFTAECIPLNKDEKTILKEELQYLVAKEIISQHISDTGVVFYCPNRTEQELAQLSQNFAPMQQQVGKS